MLRRGGIPAVGFVWPLSSPAPLFSGPSLPTPLSRRGGTNEGRALVGAARRHSFGPALFFSGPASFAGPAWAPLSFGRPVARSPGPAVSLSCGPGSPAPAGSEGLVETLDAGAQRIQTTVDVLVSAVDLVDVLDR